MAEMVGTMVFALYGSATTLSGTTNSSLNNAIGNGWTLSVIIYITANISGAHINPSVTLATILTGHISIGKGLMYIGFQIVGSILGSLILVGLITPTVVIGNSQLPSGCFGKVDIDGGQLFGWELIMTYVLVMTVYAVAIGEPSFGIAAPFAVGLALLVSVQAAGKFTGGALNPARALGPSIVFNCRWQETWIYVLAEIAGGLLAGASSLPLYGRGKDFMKLTRINKLTDLLDDEMDVTAVMESPVHSETGMAVPVENGLENGHTNGHANGHANGYSNGYVEGVHRPTQVGEPPEGQYKMSEINRPTQVGQPPEGQYRMEEINRPTQVGQPPEGQNNMYEINRPTQVGVPPV
jgi:MIP family channel proteins